MVIAEAYGSVIPVAGQKLEPKKKSPVSKALCLRHSTFVLRHSARGARSHFHHFGFLVPKLVVDRLDEAVSEFLNILLQISQTVFGQGAAGL